MHDTIRAPGTFFAILSLLALENMRVEELLQALVRKVDAELLGHTRIGAL